MKPTGRFLVALFVLLSMPQGGIEVDDAWITFRYAQNFAAGHGLHYVVGDSHLGTTSPMFAMLLGIGSSITRLEIPTLAWLAHAAALISSGWIAERILRRVHEPSTAMLGWLLPIVLATAEPVRSTLGMETLVFAVAGLLVVMLARDPKVVFGVAASAFCLLRPDGVVLVAICLAIAWWREKRVPRRALVAIACCAAAWCAYAMLAFGSPIPATLGAKLGQASSTLWMDTFASHLRATFVPEHAVLVSAGVCGAVVSLWTRSTGARIVVLWALAHNAAFALAGVPPYHWYFVPLTVQLGYLSVHLVASSAAFISRRLAPTTARELAPVAALAVTCVALAWPFLGSLRLPTDLAPRQNRYTHLGRWLERNTPRAASVAMAEVGLLGYLGRREVVDVLGLVTNGLADRVADGTHVDEALRRYDPDYLVVHVPEWRHETGMTRHGQSRGQLAYRFADCAIYEVVRMPLERCATAVSAVAPRSARVFLSRIPGCYAPAELVRTIRAKRADLKIVDELANASHAVTFDQLDARGPQVHALDDASVTYDSTAVRSWIANEIYERPDRPGHWVTSGPAGTWTARLDLAGPLRRLHVRLRLEDGVDGANLTLLWSGNARDAVEASLAQRVEIGTGAGSAEYTIELPPRFGTGDELETLILAPSDRPAGFEFESLRFDRY